MIKIKYIFAATAMVMLAGCAMPGTDAGSQGQMAKTYEVFFDLGRADIGEVSAEVIQQAALSAKQRDFAGITLMVRADNTASGRSLSDRRAATVKAELVKGGVPAAMISKVTEDLGSQLSATKDGVLDLQNRRIEIILR